MSKLKQHHPEFKAKVALEAQNVRGQSVSWPVGSVYI